MSPERFVKGESERTRSRWSDTWINRRYRLRNTCEPKGFSPVTAPRISSKNYSEKGEIP